MRFVECDAGFQFHGLESSAKLKLTPMGVIGYNYIRTTHNWYNSMESGLYSEGGKKITTGYGWEDEM